MVTISDAKMLQAILDKIVSVEGLVKENIKKTEQNGKRIDVLGSQLAEVDDDTPTLEEFENLEKRVTKLETSVGKN